MPIELACLIGNHIEEITGKCLSSGVYERIESFFAKEENKPFCDFLKRIIADKRDADEIVRDADENDSI